MACRERVSRVVAMLAAAWLGMTGWLHAAEKKAQLAASPLPAPAKEAQVWGPYSGTVVDLAGQPAAGVKVQLACSDSKRAGAIKVAESTTDAKGRFHLAKSGGNVGGPVFPPAISARDAQGHLGSSGYLYGSKQSGNDKITIKLMEVRDFRGRLTDAAGQPIAKATIRPYTWWTDRNGTRQPQECMLFPPGLLPETETLTGADGAFVLRGVPNRGQISVAMTAPGFGALRANMSLEKPATVRLERLGHVSGSVTCAKAPTAVAGIPFSLYSVFEDGPPTSRSVAKPRVFYERRATSGQDGSFRFEDVGAGQYRLMPGLAESSPYYAEMPQTLQVKPGETMSVAVVLQVAVAVKGKVIDKQTKAGIAGVRVSLHFPEEIPRSYMPKTGVSDAQGEFTIYTRPGGKAQLQVFDFPAEYLRPASPRPSDQVEITKDTTLPPIELDRGQVREGIVVDSAGKPVAGAEIHFAIPDSSFFMPHETIRSDAAGKFSLKKIPPGPTIVVRARTEKAAADPVTVIPADAAKPMRLVASEAKASGLRGRLVDDSGQAINEAAVNLHTTWWFGRSGFGVQVVSIKTDAEGRFAIGGLWPGEKYQVQIAAEGCEKYASREVPTEPGKVHDFGKIVLNRAGGTVEGLVVDSAGKPLAEVRVFNSGDGPEPMSTQSDAAGRFRLAGFRRGPVWVFADKEGYRFTGVRTTSGVKGLSLKVLRKGEPVPPRSPIAPIPEEQKKQFARQLLEQTWATCDRDEMWDVVSAMGRIDIEQARKWAAASAGKYDSSLRWRLVEKAAETDLDEALALAAQARGGGFYTLKQLAEHLSATDPAKAMRCVEEALVRARAQDQPARARSLAEVGVLAVRLGNTDGGRKLIEEAADMVAKMASSETGDRVRGEVAGALAASDSRRALSLLEAVTDKRERERQRCRVASALDDVKQAEALLKGAESYYAEQARLRLACRLAPKNAAEGVRFVENMPRSPYGRGEENKAQAFGWLAVTIAPRDKKLACSLVDRAFAIYGDPSERERDASGRSAARVAFLAVQAYQIGYPDMESLVYRTLALRPTAKNTYNAAAAVEGSATMAMLLAIVDADAAKQVLQSIESRSDSIGSGYSGVGRDTWFKAWALADPKYALELTQRELAAAKDKPQKQAARRIAVDVVNAWLQPSPVYLKDLGVRLSIMSPDREF